MAGLVNVFSANNVKIPLIIYSRSKKYKKPKQKPKSDEEPVPDHEVVFNPPLKNEPSNPYLPVYIFSAILLLIYLYTRLITLQLPLSRDEGAYAYLGRLAIQGEIPFRDFYEMKPPLLYYTFGIGTTLFGYSDTGLRLFALFLNVTTAILIYKICKQYLNRSSSVFASVIYLVLLMNAGAFGFAMISEQIVNVFIAAGYFFVLNKTFRYRYFTSGLFFGSAMLVKQTSLILAMPAFFYLLYIIWKNREKIFTNKKIWLFASGFLSVLIFFFIFLAITGAFKDAGYWLWTYPKDYAGKVTSAEMAGVFKYRVDYLFSQSPVLLTALIFSLLANGYFFISKKSLVHGFILLLFLFCFLSVVPGFRFYGQYWQLLMPVSAASIAFAFYSLGKNRIWKISEMKFIALILGIVIIADIFLHYDYFSMKEKNSIVKKAFAGSPFTEIGELSKMLKDRISTDDKIFVFGSEPQVYVYTKKNAVSKHTYHALISRNTEQNRKMEEECFEDFKRERPRFAVFNVINLSWMFKEDSPRMLYTSGYNLLDKDYEKIFVYQLGSGRLFSGNEAKNFYDYSGELILVYQLKTNEQQ